MIVTCEACFTNFNLNDELIKPSGSKVRCSKCHKVFKVFPFASEDISPPLPIELLEKNPDLSLSPPLLVIPELDGPGLKQMASADHSPGMHDMPKDFLDIAEFDFSELDKLLQEDNKDKSEKALHEPPEDHPAERFLTSDGPSEPMMFSEEINQLTEADFSDISLDLTQFESTTVDPLPDSTAPLIVESEPAIPLTGPADDSLESAPSEISYDESIDRADDQPTDMFIESETITEMTEPELQDFSLNGFEKTLEMDFSDISLISGAEPENSDAQSIGVADTELKSDQGSENSAFSGESTIDFNDIEALELSDLEVLLEKQEDAVSQLNDGVESIPRVDTVFIPLPTSSKTEQKLEMEDPFLTFDELQLDTDGTKPDTLKEVKQSFQPHVFGIPAPATAPAFQDKPIIPETVSENQEKDFSPEADADAALEERRPEPQKGINPAIRIALFLGVIAASAYGGYLLLNSMGISIPFISQPAPKVSDSGNLSIKSFDINSRFVDNAKMGKLFVVTGKVKNEYTVPRGFIQISGRIYTKDKTLAKTQSVYCGNMLSDAELAGADSVTLQQRLQNKSGDNRVNLKVLPGAVIPFMIVFTDLPANLEEFTTEIISSVAP